MEKIMERTPTPWEVRLHDLVTSTSGRITANCASRGPSKVLEEDLANAQFIVKACNAHDTLLKALTV